VEVEEKGRKVLRNVPDTVSTPLEIERTRANAAFHLKHRQKGLLWYSTYGVDFAGAYVFRNTTDKAGALDFNFRFPAANAVYDDLKLTVNGKPVAFTNSNEAIQAKIPLDVGEAATLAVSYHSQGLDRWAYRFSGGVAQVRDFALTMDTDFKAVDFPDNALSPTAKQETPGGWQLTWQYSKLVSGCRLGLEMPQKLQPGPLAGEISYFAPVSLFFFFVVMLVITTIRGIEMHPVNYFFLATAFFAFHLLMAYLVDHISIHLAFAISSVVSIFLVVSYLRLVVGLRFALVEAGLAQFLYLVLFSYAFFFEGFTGLAITIGSIVTLFVLMQITGRIKWTEKLASMEVRAAKPKNGRLSGLLDPL
jgi:inner membrane protein CreD